MSCLQGSLVNQVAKYSIVYKTLCLYRYLELHDPVVFLY